MDESVEFPDIAEMETNEDGSMRAGVFVTAATSLAPGKGIILGLRFSASLQDYAAGKYQTLQLAVGIEQAHNLAALLAQSAEASQNAEHPVAVVH